MDYRVTSISSLSITKNVFSAVAVNKNTSLRPTYCLPSNSLALNVYKTYTYQEQHDGKGGHVDRDSLSPEGHIRLYNLERKREETCQLFIF